MKCFQQGFPLHFHGQQNYNLVLAPNLLSAKQHPQIVDRCLNKELANNRLARPFSSPPFKHFRISPLGLVPKKVPGEFRLIHHLSYPKGSSVNDGISADDSTVQYSRVDDAVRLIRKAGRGSYLAKTDIKSAFRIIPIRPADYCLLGMQWRGSYFYDRCMPMGCASSCQTFETFSSAVEWVARVKLNIPLMLHLLDDFLIVAPSHQLCSSQLSSFLGLCKYLGIPMAPEKTIGPSTVLSFAGIELDTGRSEARLPHDKLYRCTVMISKFLQCKKVTLKELQSFIGLLNFACSVVVPGRAFLRRLIDLTMGVKKGHHLVRLTKAVKGDLSTWLAFLSDFNGCSFFLDEGWHTSATLQLYTDASGSKGFGAVFGNRWCYGVWPESWKSFHISALEFYPIVLSVMLWGNMMRNQRITFFTDNEALVHVINKCSCRDQTLMAFVRKLVLACLQYNILFRAKHVPGVHNEIADSLSRLQIDRFRCIAPPIMERSPTSIPLHLLPQNWEIS